jgi:hypothetical protein
MAICAQAAFAPVAASAQAPSGTAMAAFSDDIPSSGAVASRAASSAVKPLAASARHLSGLPVRT